jgi:hypothetical protein
MLQARWWMTVALLGAGAALAGACAQGGESTGGLGGDGDDDECESILPDDGPSGGETSGGDPSDHGSSGADGSSGEADDGSATTAGTSGATSGGATTGATSGGATSGGATTGGTSGTSSGGDPVGSCNSESNCDNCFDCALASDCAAEVDACLGNQACFDVDNCVYECGADQLCFEGCLQMPGGQQWLDVGACIYCYACPDPCPEEAQGCY